MSEIDGFFAIIDKWQISIERAGELLGGMPRSTVYKLKSAAGTLRQDKLTRISYVTTRNLQSPTHPLARRYGRPLGHAAE